MGRAAAPPRDLLRHGRVRDRASLVARAAPLAARGDRVAALLGAHPGRGEAAPADPPAAGRGPRDVPAPHLPGRQDLLHRGSRHDDPDARRGRAAGRRGGHRGGRLRHGAPRAAERAGPRAAPAVPRHLRGVRGRARARRRDAAARPRLRRRQVPPRRQHHAHVRGRRRDPRDPAVAGAEPVAPGVREPGRDGPHPGAGDRLRRAGLGHARPPPRAQHPHPRRLGLLGPGHRRGVAQPRHAPRLHRRRRAAPDLQQPDRLHHRSARLPLDAALVRPGEGLQRPDHPRQRRPPGRLPRRRAAGDGLPGPLRARRADRPRRLPTLGPQRGRRARLHAPQDVRPRAHPQADRRAVRGGDRRRRDRHRGRGRRDARPRDAPAEGGARPRPRAEVARAAGRARALGDADGRQARTACASSTPSCSRRPRASPSTPSSRPSWRGAPRRSTTPRSTGRPPSRWRWPRCCATASTCA